MEQRNGRSCAKSGSHWLTNRLLIVSFYLLVSVVFTALYFKTTEGWNVADFRAYAGMSAEYPGYVPAFKSRILMPLMIRGLAYVTNLDLAIVFKLTGVLAVFALLAGYRRFLADFLHPGFATLFSVAIVYPLAWNFCVLNNLYFPFDLPAIAFFAIGCHLIHARKWVAYYAVFALATLNRETSCLLTFVFLFGTWGGIQRKSLVVHVLAQALLWAGLRGALFAMVGGNPGLVTKSHLGSNARVVIDMILLRASGPRDLVKMLLVFGGAWALLPWIARRQPVFLKRSLLVLIPLAVLVAAKGVLDEVRLYGEAIPIIMTPVIYKLAAELGGARVVGGADRQPTQGG